jgi:hypothetical protein
MPAIRNIRSVFFYILKRIFSKNTNLSQLLQLLCNTRVIYCCFLILGMCSVESYVFGSFMVCNSSQNNTKTIRLKRLIERAMQHAFGCEKCLM